MDGWLHTGDIGRFDEDGYLQIVDRIKDMIIRGGENVYPKEIENAFYSHPDVHEVAVVGASHDVLGEVPVAFVALREGSDATVDDLAHHVAQCPRGPQAPRADRSGRRDPEEPHQQMEPSRHCAEACGRPRRAVVVAGVGLVPFQTPSRSETYDVLGEQAIRVALADAAIALSEVDQAFAGYVYADSAARSGGAVRGRRDGHPGGST